MATIHKIIDKKQLIPYFQPIVSLIERNIVGYEAIIYGPTDSPLHHPLDLLNAADYFHLRTKLGIVSWKSTLKRYAKLASNEKLFIKLSPATLLQPDFKTEEASKLLNQFDVNPNEIVIEITTSQLQTDNDCQLMSKAVTRCQKLGFKIAVNYLGAGSSNVRCWAKFLPEFIKIDAQLMRGIHNDAISLNFVKCIQRIANSLNCNLIAEGIDNEAEFNVAEQLGIPNMQGNYFALPEKIPIEKINKSLFLNWNNPGTFNDTKIAQIVKLITPIPSGTTVSEVMNLFNKNSELTIIPLVDGHETTGIIYRVSFLSKLFSTRFGLDLYGKKPIRLFTDELPLSFEQNTPIEVVSKKLTSAMRSDQVFIVTDDDKYTGIGTVMDLLAEITRHQIHNAKHANPLTLLPGIVPINEQINQLLSNKTPFAFGYFDLDHFKPYNDVYGYSAGDNIIKEVAKVLNQNINPKIGLVGHIGGDDFVVIIFADDWLKCCECILEKFNSTVPNYYTPEDMKAGGIHTENRQGERCFFPIISLSVGLISPISTSLCQSHVDIADLASEAKKQAKKIVGNSFYVNQRVPRKNQG